MAHVKHFTGRLMQTECLTGVSHDYGKEFGLCPKREACRVVREETGSVGLSEEAGTPLDIGHQVQVSEDGGLDQGQTALELGSINVPW